MGSADDERLQRIEIHLAHLERQSEELNGVVIEQGKQISRLQTLVNQLTESVEQAEGDRIRATSARPPALGTAALTQHHRHSSISSPSPSHAIPISLARRQGRRQGWRR
jgi:uncharacterized coiled-coil protein SlyX